MRKARPKPRGRSTFPAMSSVPLFVFCAICSLVAPGRAQGQFTTVLNIPPGPDIGDNQSIGSDTLLNLFPGGAIGSNFDAGDPNGSSTNVEVNVFGGIVGSYLPPFYFNANAGSEVNVYGGSIESHISTRNESSVNIFGGTLESIYADTGSDVNLYGGLFRGDFNSDAGSDVSVFGSEFRLDGVLIPGLESPGSALPIELPYVSRLTGTFADGTPFAFIHEGTFDDDSDSFADGTLTLNTTSLPAIGPTEISLPSDPVPLGVRAGQTLVVGPGGSAGDSFNAGRGSTVLIDGGEVGGNLEAAGAHVVLSSGSVGGGFDALDGATVDIIGGTVDDLFSAFGSTVNISGGTIGQSFTARNGTTVNISGGSLSYGSKALDGSTINISGGLVADLFATSLDGSSGNVVNISRGTVDRISMKYSTLNMSGGSVTELMGIGFRSTANISGGQIGDQFVALPESNVGLFGTQFILDSLDITGSLTVGVPFTITDRDVTMEGLLADGSPFSFDLNSALGGIQDYFDPNAMLTLTLVPPGDFNGDLTVDGTDFLKWQRGKSPNPFSSSDLAAWEANYGTTFAPLSSAATTVPEPVGLLLVAMLSFVAPFFRSSSSVFRRAQLNEETYRW